MKKAIGYISYTHGLDGKVKIVPLVPKNDFENYISTNQIKIDNGLDEMLSLSIFAFTGKIFLCKVDNINNIDDAKKILKHEIFIELDDDSYINPESLLNFDVFLVDKKKEKYGKIVDFGNYGAGDLIEVETIKGKREFYLCNKNYIVNIDKNKRSIMLKIN